MNNINRMFNLVKYLFIILFNYRICNRNNTYIYSILGYSFTGIKG